MMEIKGVTAEQPTIVWNRRTIAQGKVKVNKIAEQYRKSGYMVLVNPTTGAGVDLIIVSLPNGKIVKAIEVTNYSKARYHINPKKFRRYVKELSFFKAIKDIQLELVVSYKENLDAGQHEELKKNAIKVVISPYVPIDEIEGWIEESE